MQTMYKRIDNKIQAGIWNCSARKDIPRFKRELSGIVEQDPSRETIIFPPGLAWEGAVIQRPQHLARALSNQGYLVLYAEPETTKQFTGFNQLTEHLVLSHVPLRTFEIIPDPFVITMTWNYKYAAQIPHARLIYDYVDHLRVFSGNQRRLAQQHIHLLRSAEIVLVTSKPLLEEVRSIRPDAILCPNGVDYEHFRNSINGDEDPPTDMAPLLLSKSPIIGYSGALAEWFDYDLLEITARQRPDLNFLLIGPDHDRSLSQRKLDLPNLFWLGSKSYKNIPTYLKYFDVAMIPFKVNELTHAVSPLKLFEYMTAGKPVVLTPMEESMRYPGVLVAEDPQEFSRRLDEALELKLNAEYLNTVRDVAKENTWEARAHQISQVMDNYSSSISHQA
jgi:glycosyltransferase involved in cell wall biosynthesis